MRRLVSVRVFCILGGDYITYGITGTLSGFPYGGTQHLRGMRSSIVCVIYYQMISTQFFISHVKSGSATCSYLVQK